MNANPPLPVIGPNVVDLAQATQPKPKDAEQVVVRTFRLPARSGLPRSMPVLAGKTADPENPADFAMTFNPEAAELYLLVEGLDHRILGLPHLLESWLKAMGGQPHPDRPRILTELDAALLAIDVARTLAEADTDHDLAVEHANAAVTSIESALRLARTLRHNIETRAEQVARRRGMESDA